MQKYLNCVFLLFFEEKKSFLESRSLLSLFLVVGFNCENFPFFLSKPNFLQQSTHGAELNSEATLNCNGKDFKCINSTHYQPCSLTERKGLPPQYMINGVTLPCLSGQLCNDENTVNCAVARTAVPVDQKKQPVQIPVEVTVEKEQPALAAEKPSEAAVKTLAAEKPSEVAPALAAEKPTEAAPALAAEKPAEAAPALAAEKPSEAEPVSSPAKSLIADEMAPAMEQPAATMDAPMDAPKESMAAPMKPMDAEMKPVELMAAPMKPMDAEKKPMESMAPAKMIPEKGKHQNSIDFSYNIFT